MTTRERPAARLSREDWISAAYEAFIRAGIGSVAVEAVAQRLGSTKGSFYWHFSNREELVSGVLDRWIENTRKIIRDLDKIEDPRTRLHTLFRDLSTSRDWARPEISLFNGAGNAQIKTALETVTSLRLAFVEGCLTEFGASITDARNGALQAYSLWIGLLQLSVAVPHVAFAGSAAAGNTDDAFFESTLRMLDGLFSSEG